MSCPITGSAVVTQLNDDEIRWDQADPQIHVSIELLADRAAKDVISQKYAIGEHCPYDSLCVHARLKSPRG